MLELEAHPLILTKGPSRLTCILWRFWVSTANTQQSLLLLSWILEGSVTSLKKELLPDNIHCCGLFLSTYVQNVLISLHAVWQPAGVAQRDDLSLSCLLFCTFQLWTQSLGTCFHLCWSTLLLNLSFSSYHVQCYNINLSVPLFPVCLCPVVSVVPK